MLRAENREQTHSIVRRWRRAGHRIALVPTMGNLHRGHIALVEAAKREADRVVASIYVNPTQFGQGEDYQSYPRTLEADTAALEKAGCDLLFVPGQSTMYPYGLSQSVLLQASPDLASVLEGKSRPGHFDGVVSVVARLFNLVCPDIAVFGEKDYQQLLVIQRMTNDLGYGIRILAVPTVREPSGLAMSSRNNYLDRVDREFAGELNAVLRAAAERVDRVSGNFVQVENDAAEELKNLGFRVDYVAIRRAGDFGEPRPGDRELRLLVAAWHGTTRLIDNVEIIRVGNSGH